MFILLALQLTANGHYVWSNMGTFQTYTACTGAITAIVKSDNSRKGPFENYVCVPTGEEPPISVGPYPTK